MFINLINNVAFLIALVAAGQIVIDRFPQKTLNRQVLLGLLFGGVALLGMANPVNFLPGVFFDGRSIVLVVAGVVGGGVTATIAAGMAAFYRYQLGGSGALVGIVVVLLSAWLGVMARQWWLRRNQPPRLIDYLALGVVVQFIQLAAFTQVPNRAGYAFIEQAWWVLLLFYPLATMLLCQIFRNHEQRLIDQEALQSAHNAVTAEERASMQRFHAYFDHSLVGLAITSLDKGWLEVNDALCTALGYTRDELTHMTWTELTYPEDLAADQAQFNRMLAGEISGYAMDKRFIHKDGHLVDTRLAVSHVSKPDGSLDYVVAMVEDVSDQRKAEKEYQDMFREMLDGFALHEIICNAQGVPEDYRFLAVNPAFERMTGLKAADIVGRSILEVLPGTEKYWIETYGKVALSGEPVFFENHSALLNKHFEVKAFRPSAGRFASIFVDVTERKRAQDALSRIVKDLRATQRISHVGSWRLDLASNQVVWTEELYKMYGFDPALPVPPYTEHKKLFTPESWEKLSSTLAHTRETGVPYTLELETVRKDGSNGWLWAHGEVEVDSAGKTVGLWGAAQDITERKRAEQDIRLAEARFRAIIDASPIPFALNDSELNITYLNSAFIQTYGYDQKDIPTVQVWWPKAYPDDRYRQEVANEWTLRLEAAKREAKPFEPLEVRIRCKDGGERTVLATGTPLASSFDDLHVVTLYDITERKQTELLLNEQLDELHRWQQTMLGREGRIISIKQEVNELLARLGQPPRYANQLPAECAPGVSQTPVKPGGGGA